MPMLTTTSIILLILIAIALGLWRNSMRAKEIATRIAKIACEKRELQFLDETVALHKLWLKRAPDGFIKFLRTYQFDYYDDNEIRQQSSITLLGDTFQSIGLNDTHDNVIRIVR